MKITLLNVIGIYILIVLVITLIWQIYEIVTFGKIMPDPFDSFITLVLALSLTLNILVVMVNRERNNY